MSVLEGMSKYLKRASITVDDLAIHYFLPQGAKARRQADSVAELQEKLQNRGDDPRYVRIIFAVARKEKFVEVFDRDVTLAGVFSRILCVRYEYGYNYEGLRSTMRANIRDTLVVVNNEEMAQVWQKELGSLGYQMRRI